VCSYAIWRHLDSTFRTRRSGRGCRASASLTQQANAGRTGAVPIGQNCEDNCQPASPVPILAALPLLYRDARWIADLDPGPTPSRSIGAVDPFRDSSLDTKPACVREDGLPILGKVFIEQDADLSVAQQPRQRGLAVEKW